MNEPQKTRRRIGRQLRKLREERRMSLRDLEKATGIHHTNLSEIERNEKGFNIDTLTTIAGALGYQITLQPVE